MSEVMERETATTADTTPAPKPSRLTSEISNGVVTLSVGTNTVGTYAMSDLPDATQKALAAIGLRYILVGATDHGKAFDEMKAGKIPGRKAAASKDLEPWRLAYAHALAEETAKRDGIKVYMPGGRNPTQEFAVLLDNSKQRAVSLDKSGLAKIKVIPAVVAHWVRITGTATTASSLISD